jgi:hypothetical protein
MRTASWILLAASTQAALLQAGQAFGQAMTNPAIAWPDSTGKDCPFPRSTRISQLKFTGRTYNAPGSGADTWYPSWAADGSMYSTFADGTVNGVTVQGFGDPGSQITGHARIDGDDPLSLKITVVSTFHNDPRPYAGRYPSASLVYNGVWYYGTYTLDDLNGACHNWCGQGPFVGFRQSTDAGKTWVDTKYTPGDPVFGESGKNGSKVKFGPVHMVDFGKNMEHSPDGHAYFVSHGAVGNSGLANWIGGDAVYLGRVVPTPENMNDRGAFEFYTGASWSHDVAQAKPIVEWTGRLGSVTVTYDAPAKAYLMWISRPHFQNNNTGPFDTLLLEADQITGPWRIVTTMDSFGSEAYFVNVPSKFISQDGVTMWLLYSANFAGGGANPPGSGYNFGIHELTLAIGPSTFVPDKDADGGDGGGDAQAPREASTGSDGAPGMVPQMAPDSGGQVSVTMNATDGAGSAGGPTESEPTAADAASSVDDAGCACRQSPARAGSASAFGALVAGAVMIGRRRRRLAS